jgi:hypothetical protein
MNESQEPWNALLGSVRSRGRTLHPGPVVGHTPLAAAVELATSRVFRHKDSHHRLTQLEPDSVQPFASAARVVLPTMSYGKKDEDADSGLVKIDRTQVFQEGEQRRNSPLVCRREQQLIAAKSAVRSSTLQQLAHPTAKMPCPSHKDRPPPLHGREVPDHGSHHPLLRHLEALPE